MNDIPSLRPHYLCARPCIANRLPLWACDAPAGVLCPPIGRHWFAPSAGRRHGSIRRPALSLHWLECGPRCQSPLSLSIVDWVPLRRMAPCPSDPPPPAPALAALVRPLLLISPRRGAAPHAAYSSAARWHQR